MGRYIPIEHALVERGDQDPADRWVGLAVISRWEHEDGPEAGCYLEQYDEDGNGELASDEWFADVVGARSRAAELFGDRLGTWEPGFPTRTLSPRRSPGPGPGGP